MLVKKYKSELIAINNPIEGIYTLEFKSLNGKYKYIPGQFLHIAYDLDYDGSGQWPDSRCFSMRSNPGDDTIKITYAVKGQFTRLMEQNLHVGSNVWLKLPYGDLFTQPHSISNTVFIAGGTGITPYLSLFTDLSFSKYQKAVLFAGFRNDEMNLYKNELEKAKLINLGLETHLIYQDKDGILDIKKILYQCEKNGSFFISGPPMMISSFKGYLLSQGITEDQIKTDDWG